MGKIIVSFIVLILVSPTSWSGVSRSSNISGEWVEITRGCSLVADVQNLEEFIHKIFQDGMASSKLSYSILKIQNSNGSLATGKFRNTLRPGTICSEFQYGQVELTQEEHEMLYCGADIYATGNFVYEKEGVFVLNATYAQTNRNGVRNVMGAGKYGRGKKYHFIQINEYLIESSLFPEKCGTQVFNKVYTRIPTS